MFFILYNIESEITYYECETCEGCPDKKSCTRAKVNRKMQLSKTFLRQREQSLQGITSEEGILLRMNRSIQVEGAFGVLKQDYGFRQFLLRGNKKVRTFDGNAYYPMSKKSFCIYKLSKPYFDQIFEMYRTTNDESVALNLSLMLKAVDNSEDEISLDFDNLEETLKVGIEAARTSVS